MVHVCSSNYSEGWGFLSCHKVNQMGWSGAWICILHIEGEVIISPGVEVIISPEYNYSAEVIISPGVGHLSFLYYTFTVINFSSMLWIQWIPVMGHWMKEWVGTFHSYVLPTQWEVLQGQLEGAQYWDRRGKMQNVPSLQHNTAGPTLLDIWFTFW